MAYSDYNRDYGSDIMESLFSGKIKPISEDSRLQLKRVELGHGNGIEHAHGSYEQYMEKLSQQASKGNGIISIGKSINVDKSMPYITDLTDKFTVGDVPHILIMYYNIINPMKIKVVWKDSEDDTISEQYYEIPSAHSMQYDWWDQYGIYFIGPEGLEEGDYKVEITSAEFLTKNSKKTLSASLEFIVVESLKTDSLKEDPIKIDSLKEDPIKIDSLKEDPIKTDSSKIDSSAAD